MNDELSGAESGAENAAVAAALHTLQRLDEAPLGQHASIYEDVHLALRAALDAD